MQIYINSFLFFFIVFGLKKIFRVLNSFDLHAPSPEMKEKVEAVERIVGYEFKNNKRLLEEALTHSSCANAVSNQRLAFMGDAVLGLAVTKYLYLEYPGITQGYLTRLRSANVSNEKFARVAVRHNFYNYLRRTAPDLDDLVTEYTKDQEKARGSMDPPKVLADIVASVAAAIFVDLNFDLEEFWKKFRHVLEPLEDLQERPSILFLGAAGHPGLEPETSPVK